MKGDIYKLLKKESSNVCISLLKYPNSGLELNNECKLLLANHWVKSGSPSNLEMNLIAVLGLDWEYYLNPFLHKIFTISLDKLIYSEFPEFNKLNGDLYDELVSYIIKYKLDELNKKVAPRGYSNEKKQSIDTKKRNLLYYAMNSKTMPYQLIKVQLDAIGYKYNISVFIMNTGIDLFDKLTEQSVKNLKGLMYFMSEDEDIGWSTEKLGECLNYLKFKDRVLNNIVKSILNYKGD